MKATNLCLKVVEENQNQVQEFVKIEYLQAKDLGVRRHKKRLLENIQKPIFATYGTLIFRKVNKIAIIKSLDIMQKK